MSDTTARLSIGEFSRLTWLSPKALRLYERRSLLRPDLVDEYTGYRYYRATQAERARTIALLRRAGMPLERIGMILDVPDSERRTVLDTYRRETIQAHERALALLDGLADGLAGPPHSGAQTSLKVSTREVEAQRYISHSVRTTAPDLPSHIERTAERLLNRKGVVIDESMPLVVAYHGEVSWESDGPIEVRVPVTEESISDGVEPRGFELFVEVSFSEVQFPTILRGFDAVRMAATQESRRPTGVPCEIYLRGEPFRCQVAQRYIIPAS